MKALNSYKLNDKLFFLILFILNLLFAFLNSKSQMMGGLMDYYRDFSIVILNGFDSNLGKMKTPAFPMWGYGWILIISNNKWFLFLIQGLISIFTINLFLIISRRLKFLTSSSLNLFKYLILFSFSYISLSYTLSPYSLSINFLIISILFYILALTEFKFLYIFISSLFYGLLLNFRSDYIYFTILLPIISYFILKKNVLRINLLWLLFVAIMLVPWMLYTYKAIGKPLITSTNSGHVFYIGLGNLPNNKWGITTSDHDKRMYMDLKKYFGDSANSLNYKEDKFLKKAFIDLVKNDPLEYGKKVIYSAAKTLISGIYVPEFYNLRNDCFKDCKSEFDWDVINNPFFSIFDSKLKFILYSITYISIIFGLSILFLSYLFLPNVFLESYRKKNYLVFISCLILLYQFLICSLAYHMRLYNSYSYFWALIIIVFYINKKKLSISNEKI